MTAPDDRLPAPDSTTRRLSKARYPSTQDAPGDSDEYSATVLSSHWIQRPHGDATVVDVPAAAASPDRVDGTVLRFGPGVTAALAHRMHATLPQAAAPTAPPRGRLRRHALPALVLIAVVVFLLWQEHFSAPVAVREVTVTAAQQTMGCDETADLVGVLRTNGRKGTLSYRWVRNDGTASATLHAAVAQGHDQARVHLLWTFQGRGHYAATAELRVLSPTRRTASVQFTYDCR
ncbi:hypothetical protein ABZ904_26275 [Streptomyces sp. NPDC046900]|uniref:hypothetical protein n=1 Tax=Streptomyces sp. NPDC046900 TaxID=3155473 RepID=UPI00340478AD